MIKEEGDAPRGVAAVGPDAVGHADGEADIGGGEVSGSNLLARQDLAARIGITVANVSLPKRGLVKDIQLKTVAKLCRALD